MASRWPTTRSPSCAFEIAEASTDLAEHHVHGDPRVVGDDGDDVGGA